MCQFLQLFKLLEAMRYKGGNLLTKDDYVQLVVNKKNAHISRQKNNKNTSTWFDFKFYIFTEDENFVTEK